MYPFYHDTNTQICESDGVTLRWPAKAGHRYTLYSTFNLLEGFNLETADIAAEPPHNTHFVPTATPTRFFRLEELPAP
jgi:hypothetical protein